MDRRRRNVDMDRNIDNMTVALQCLVRHCNVRVFLLMLATHDPSHCINNAPSAAIFPNLAHIR